MMDDFAGAFIIIAILCYVAFNILVTPISVRLYDAAWECTEVVIQNGQPMCIKYERKKSS